MAERKQYLLRSGNTEVIHVPIHIQSAGDTEFLSMLQNQQVLMKIQTVLWMGNRIKRLW